MSNQDDEVLKAAVQAGTFALARPGSLPDWMSIVALGRDMMPLAKLAVEAAYPVIVTHLRENSPPRE